VADRAWLAELEGHWDLFRDAGWVERVTVEAVDPDTGAATATAARVDAIRHGDGIRREEVPGPDGSMVIVERLEWQLRASGLGSLVVRKRAKVADGDGAVWLSGRLDVAADGNVVVCDTVKQ
jgi:hypothetical protein